MDIFKPRSFIYELVGYIALVLAMLFVARLNILPEGIVDDVQWIWLWSLLFISVTVITLRTIHKKENSILASFWFGLFSGAIVWTLFIVLEIQDMELLSDIMPYFALDIIMATVLGAAVALLWSLFISFVYKKLKEKL